MKSMSILVLLVLFGALFFGCGGDENEDRGKAPVIRAVFFYSNASPVPTSNVNAGDRVTFVAHFEDPDLDITTLHVAVYDLANTSTIYDGPTVYGSDSGQWSESTVSQELDVAFETGEYRIDFQAVDEPGHVSLIFRKKLYVL